MSSKTFKILGLALATFWLVGLASSWITVARTRAAYQEFLDSIIRTDDDRDPALRWANADELARSPILDSWKPRTDGYMGRWLEHGYVWLPTVNVRLESRTSDGSFAWAYFRPCLTLPFVAVVDLGMHEHLRYGGQYSHDREAYLCVFGYRRLLGRWSVGGMYSSAK